MHCVLYTCVPSLELCFFSSEGVDLPLPNGRSYTPPVTPSMVSKVIQVLPSRSNAADTADATLEVETTVSEIQHSVEQRKGIVRPCLLRLCHYMSQLL